MASARKAHYRHLIANCRLIEQRWATLERRASIQMRYKNGYEEASLYPRLIEGVIPSQDSRGTCTG